jgi:hypothetical protein
MIVDLKNNNVEKYDCNNNSQIDKSIINNLNDNDNYNYNLKYKIEYVELSIIK